MIVSPLLAVSFVMKLVAVLFVFCAVVLILVILVQKGRGGGLAGALGGGMASNILGSKTGDFLTWVTIVVAVLFLSLAGLMAKYYRPHVSEFSEQTGPASTQNQKQSQPAESQPGPAGTTDSASDVNKG